MICTECFYVGDCSLKSACVDRCNVFLKSKKVKMGDNIWVNLIDTIQMTYDDYKDLLKDIDMDIDIDLDE